MSFPNRKPADAKIRAVQILGKFIQSIELFGNKRHNVIRIGRFYMLL